MNRYLIILGVAVFLFIPTATFLQEQQGEVEIPEEIRWPSAIGEVEFSHELHCIEEELECVDCHHEINAAKLTMPHEDYFEDFWIDCKICHRERNATKMVAKSCSKCHHASPNNIADETLSSKVVLHKNCWDCHDVGTGKIASRSCEDCHSGPKAER